MLLHGPRTDRFPLFDVRLSNSGDGMIIHVSISLFLMDGFTELILKHELATLYFAASSIAANGGLQGAETILEVSKLPSIGLQFSCLLYTSPSPRDGLLSRMPSSA